MQTPRAVFTSANLQVRATRDYACWPSLISLECRANISSKHRKPEESNVCPLAKMWRQGGDLLAFLAKRQVQATLT